MPRSVFHANPVSPAPRKAAPPRPAPAPAAPPHARATAPTAAPPRPAPSPEIQGIGRDQFLTAFNAGRPLGNLLAGLAADALQGYAGPLVGAMDAATGALDYIQRERLVKRWLGDAEGWDGKRFRQEGNRLLALGRTHDFYLLLARLSAMLEGARTMHPQLRLEIKADEPAPAAAPEPVRVEVISMPARVTTSEVSRDEAGNISSVSQIERDLKAA